MVGGLNHLTLAVRDLAPSFAFYTKVVGFRPLARWCGGAYLLAGESTWVCLSVDENTRPEPRIDYTHVAFTVDKNHLPAIRQRIMESGAQEWKPNRSEGESIYFLDPDGHKLEVHVGDWRSRLQACRDNPYQGMEFF